MDMPVDLVTPESIEARFYRALTSDETRILPSWIEDSWEELLDLDYLRLPERLTADPPEERLLGRIARVIRSSVLRRLQNPQGRRQYSYSVDDASVSETLASETLAIGWFTADELDKLEPAGSSDGAFTIRVDAHLPDPLPGEGWPWILR